VLERDDEAGDGDLRPPGRAGGVGRPGQGGFVLSEAARIGPHREVAGEGEPQADDVVVLDVGNRQVTQRLGGVEERRQIDVEESQIALDGGDGDLPRRRPVGTAHERGGAHASRMVEHQGLGDPAPQGMTGHPDRVLPTEMIEESHGVGCHLFHAVGPFG
jgi:hypothetical protein